MQIQRLGSKKYLKSDFKDYLFIDFDVMLMGYVKDKKLLRIVDIADDDVGSIYRARIKNIDRDLNAAFVDIGSENTGFLQLKKNEDVKESEIKILQVIKKPENKGVKLSLDVSIPGRYFVVFPFENFVKFSKKLEDDFKDKFREEVLKIVNNEDVGILIRTEAKKLDHKDFFSYLKTSIDRAKRIKSEDNKLPVPKLLYKRDMVLDFLENYPKGMDIITNQDYKNSDFNIISDDSFSIKYKDEIISKYKTFFDKNIVLDSGPRIIIEKTEALTVIDIDTFKYNSKSGKNFENTSYEVNTKVIDEIFNQIVNRNISGIIIIDLLKMKKKSHKVNVLSKFKEKLFEDENIKFLDYTNLGLLEISRKNSGRELKNIFGDWDENVRFGRFNICWLYGWW